MDQAGSLFSIETFICFLIPQCPCCLSKKTTQKPPKTTNLDFYLVQLCLLLYSSERNHTKITTHRDIAGFLLIKAIELWNSISWRRFLKLEAKCSWYKPLNNNSWFYLFHILQEGMYEIVYIARTRYTSTLHFSKPESAHTEEEE